MSESRVAVGRCGWIFDGFLSVLVVFLVGFGK